MDNSDNLSDNWRTIDEAVSMLGVSRRTIDRRIKKGEFKSKLVGNRRYVYIDTTLDNLDKVSESVSHRTEPLLEQLQKENEYLKGQNQSLQRQLEEVNKTLADVSQRHDTIVLQLTRQLEQSQRLLEYHQQPVWKRWFSRKRLAERTRRIVESDRDLE